MFIISHRSAIYLVALLCFLPSNINCQLGSSCNINYNQAQNWGVMCNGAWGTCTTGQHQSPIQLDSPSADQDHNIMTSIYFGPTFASSYNATGIARIDVAKPASPSIIGGPLGGTHFLSKITFHAPSEHTFSNFRASAEAQFWHQNSNGNLSYVLNLLFIDNSVTNNPWIDTILTGMQTNSTTIDLDPQDWLPEDYSYFYYSGSDTVPPCTEGWTWLILESPVSVTTPQIAAIRSWQGLDRFRPLQPTFGRNVTVEYVHVVTNEASQTFPAIASLIFILCIISGIIGIFIHQRVQEVNEQKTQQLYQQQQQPIGAVSKTQ